MNHATIRLTDSVKAKTAPLEILYWLEHIRSIRPTLDATPYHLGTNKTQAKVWPVILWQAVKMASGLLGGACVAAYITLGISHAGILTPERYVKMLGLHFSCNFIIAQLCMEFW